MVSVWRIFACGLLASASACADGNASKRPIEMVALPPLSASPEPISVPEPSDPPPPPPPLSDDDASSGPTQLPARGSRPSSSSEAATDVPSEGELTLAISTAGWSVSSVRTAHEGSFDVTTAVVKKARVRGRVWFARPRADAPNAEVPHLPANANIGVIVERAAGKGAEAYFYDQARQRLARVELKTPGTEREAGDLLRAAFPFAH